MQGFIEVTQQGNPILIGVNAIRAIASSTQGGTLITIDADDGYFVDESYEEVKRRLNSLFT
jgi:hypothetical protein